MSLERKKLGDALDLFNGKKPELAEDGEFVVFGSNGTIGRSGKFNQPSSVILGRVGAYCGAVKFSSEPFWASDNTIVTRPKGDQDLKYWYYKLQTIPLRGYAGGAAQPLITHSIIKPIETDVHKEKLEQERISGVLSAYDDLIENNRRRIELLEDAARLLYREWFVRLHFPGCEHAKIVDGLPEGWTEATFDGVCSTVGGGTPSTKVPEYWDNADVTWITPTDITRNDCLALLEGEKKISEAGLKNSSAKLVPPNTILMTSRASVGFFGLIDREVCTNQGFINIVPNEERLRFYLLFNLMNRVGEIRSHAGGTTYVEISKGKFRALPVIVPTDDLLEDFDMRVRPILEQVRVLKKYSVELAKARDLLLPRLMDGRLEV